MRTKILILSIILFSSNVLVLSQSHFPGYYAVYFKNKNNTVYSIDKPETYLSSKAIERRKTNMTDIDSTDLPVSNADINLVSAFGHVKYTSRWQNSALLIITDSMKLEVLKTLARIEKTEYLGPFLNIKSIKSTEDEENSSFSYEPVLDSFPAYGASLRQVDMIGLTPLHYAGYRGKGVLMAILDAGFNSADKMKSFSRLFERKGVVATKDFVKKGNNVFKEHSHGSMVLSTIAGIIPGKYYGSAPEADFLLLRTEDVYSEYPVEEYYWLAGAEYADSAGADIISSSLSYSTFDDSTLNHNISMLDGKSTIVSRAASSAFSKGILVTVSAGNSGNNSWRKIGFPADADGVFTIGAVDTTGMYASFSSQGYSADGRVKPDMAATGKDAALISSGDKVFHGNGTSFSTPIFAGGLACLLQANKNITPNLIRSAVLTSGHNFFKPDSLTGYGLPDFFAANMLLKGKPAPPLRSDDFSFQTIPNPFSGGFYLVSNTTEASSFDVSIWNMEGKLIWKSSYNKNKGLHAFYIGDISEMKNGIYLLTIKALGKTYRSKIIKQK